MSDVEGWKGRRAATPGKMGVLVDMVRDLRRQVAALQKRATLNSASISSGGLAIKDGGGLAIEDGGDLVVEGGSVVVADGGRFSATYPDGSASTIFGPLVSMDTGETVADGLLVQAPESAGGNDIFRAGHARGSSQAVVYIGQGSDTTIDTFVTWSDEISLNSTGNTFLNAGGDVVLRPASGRTVWAHLETKTGTANVLYDGAGTGGGIEALYRTGSSLRYKQDIQDLDLSHLTPDQIVDALHGRTWRDKGEVKRNPDTTERIPGHIAEELHDAGLNAFVIYDPDGRPDAVAYDRLSGALAQALRTTRDELAAERTRIDDLEKKVAALAAPTTQEDLR